MGEPHRNTVILGRREAATRQSRGPAHYDSWVLGFRRARPGMTPSPRVLAVGLSITMLAALSGPAHALDRRVRIINDSKHVITAFYRSNVSAEDWGDSLLGADPLKPGTSVVLDFEDNSGFCRFRFRAVFDDGKELLRQSVNICEVGTYRYTE